MVMQKNDRITNNIINRIAKTIEMFDLTPLEARLFAYLFIEREPKTLDEMGHAIGKSKTAMSTNVRSLLELNLVTRVWKKGVRKDLYQVNTPLFKTFKNAYVKKWLADTSHQLSNIEEIKNKQIRDEKYTPNKNAYAIHEIREFHKQLERTFKLMEKS